MKNKKDRLQERTSCGVVVEKTQTRYFGMKDDIRTK